MQINSSAQTAVLNVMLVAQMKINSIASLADNNVMPVALMQTSSAVPPAVHNAFLSSNGGSQCYASCSNANKFDSVTGR